MSILSQKISENFFHSVAFYLKAIPEYVILSEAKDLPSFGPRTNLWPSLPSTDSTMPPVPTSYSFVIL